MRTAFAYTSARILMFGCSVILLYLAGARGVLLLALGLVISALASYILLNKQRQIIAGKLNGRLGKVGAKATARVTEFRDRLEDGTAAEDDEVAAAPDSATAPDNATATDRADDAAEAGVTASAAADEPVR
jgi:UPF0716 family protein affecting phage T7 exclusion